jgi:flagellar basal-body rod modification protein FlgD
MPITDVVPIDSAQYFGLKPGAVKKKDLDMQAFIELLAVQLSNQNPLEPMNDRDFFAQMAQLGTVQGIDRMQSSMQISQASSLIGRTVTAFRPMTESTSGTNELVTGRAVGLSIRNGEHILSLKQEGGGLVDVKMTAIRSVNE